MSKFPLYDSLSKDLSEKDLTPSQKRAFIKRVIKIDKNGHELVYALIRMYQVENNEENTSFNLPYNGIFVDTQKSRDISFDVDNFPIHLKQLLFKFLGVHIEKMKEERQIEKATPVKRV